ncbi:VOC family protein [Siccirubricoccus sp. KC 17139]|uniref:VOC family protein n=1 Tax=Siccirubricoccus soli TaxID=2899147 RepID=A0ABT1D9H5_9PROT|nr:VOC family protein [Siccirubricoccus soli]MCP2684715.1 VOC family protein [Siccirubricoccus soli]
MIDHVSIPVSTLALGGFYDAVLRPLGLARLVERPRQLGYGKRYPELWLNLREGHAAPAGTGHHLCLRAPDEAAVRAFHAAALAAGGRDDGAPGPRAAAMTGYYAAFILDPDGNRLEAATFPRG